MEPPSHRHLIHRVLAVSHLVMLVAVVSTLISSLVLLLYGVLLESRVVIDTLRDFSVSTQAGKALALGLIDATDVFLIGIVLFVVGLGLYSLFIDDTLPLPPWLEIHKLDDLKSQLVSVVIAVLAVLFLGEAVKWDGGRDVVGFGVAIALVVGALSLFLAMKTTKSQADYAPTESDDVLPRSPEPHAPTATAGSSARESSSPRADDPSTSRSAGPRGS